jgi:hypothetical protein
MREVTEFLSTSRMNWVIIGFVLIAVVNFSTYFIGPSTLLVNLKGSVVGSLLANFVFDSWGTIIGILGILILFSTVLLGTPKNKRKSLCVFFLAASVAIGLTSSLFWNYTFGGGGRISFGSSAIDISGQSIIFTIAIYELILSFAGTAKPSKVDPLVRNSFRIIYVTLIGTTVWFIFSLQPIFFPTDSFNWRVHEIAFLLGILVAGVFLLVSYYKVGSVRSEYQVASHQL